MFKIVIIKNNECLWSRGYNKADELEALSIAIQMAEGVEDNNTKVYLMNTMDENFKKEVISAERLKYNVGKKLKSALLEYNMSELYSDELIDDYIHLIWGDHPQLANEIILSDFTVTVFIQGMKHIYDLIDKRRHR